MHHLILFIICSLSISTTVSAYNNPLVHLDYGHFQGKYDATYNLSYFRKIPFAAPPTGQNRFRAPQPPLNITENIYDTDKDFDMCPQRTVNGSEDCLYLGLFSRPWDDTSKLFSKALASSPFWPKTYAYDAPEAEDIYTRLANLTGCASSNHEHETLACLKSVDVQRIRDASLAISADHTWTTSSYTWAPVIDGEFLVDTLTDAVSHGSLKTEFLWGMYNSHEGENFVPSGLKASVTPNGFNSSTASFHQWLTGFVPGLSTKQIAAIEDVYYPMEGDTETIDAYNTSFVRAGLVYRDLVLACPAYWIATAARDKGYLGEYTISPATHGSDTIYWNRINSAQQTNRLVYEGYAGAFASFFQTGDPNAHKLTNASTLGVPELHETGKEFVIVDHGIENVQLAQLKKRCKFWQGLGNKIPI